MGFSGIAAQILLIRELLISFSGNELSIGIILANWLIAEAIGSYFIGKKIDRFANKLGAFVFVQNLFALSFPISIYLTRIVRDLIGYMPGEGLGLIPIVYSSFLILLPLSVTHGALFTFCCRIFADQHTTGAESIGKVYVFETLGTLMGGIVLTLLIPILPTFTIVFIITTLNFFTSLYLIFQFASKGKFYLISSAILLLLSGTIIFTGQDNTIHSISIEKQWRGSNILHYENSFYGNTVLAKMGEQNTMYFDGIPIVTTPSPDIAFIEEFVHFTMLSHPNPKSVLILSGGVGGVIREILKYNIERIDYVELDHLIIDVLKKYQTQVTADELNNPKVHISNLDGRLFVTSTTNKYDVILIGLDDPKNLQSNRLFTIEFFRGVEKILNPSGIVTLSLPSSLSYLTKELANLNKCILNTLEVVFPYVRTIPWDYNLISAAKLDIKQIGAEHLKMRMINSGIEFQLLTPQYLDIRLHERWLHWFEESSKIGTNNVNVDFKPLAVFFSLAYWNSLFSPVIQQVFHAGEVIKIEYIVLAISVLAIVLLAVLISFKKSSVMAMPLCITTTGFAGMIFDLALIYAFQVIYGYVFYWIGLLITAFMIGAAIGGWLITRYLSKIRNDYLAFLFTDIFVLVFTIILSFSIFQLNLSSEFRNNTTAVQIIFILLSLFSGFVISAQFPLANKIYLTNSQSLSVTAGLLYSADLLGGWIGGILGGVFLFTLFGFFQTLTIVLMLKVISALVLIVVYLMRK